MFLYHDEEGDVMSVMGQSVPVHGYQGVLLSESQACWMYLSDVKVMRRLIASLKYVFGLGHGVELPFILGCPQCANNDEALISWVTGVS